MYEYESIDPIMQFFTYGHLPENFQCGDKGSALEEAIGQLESGCGSIPEIDSKDPAGKIKVMFLPTLAISSRSDRCCAAVAILPRVEAELPAEHAELKNELDNAVSELEYVDFPGMF